MRVSMTAEEVYGRRFALRVRFSELGNLTGTVVKINTFPP